MLRPDWKYAPSWAKYAAMDDDREWWWFEDEPTYTTNYWRVDTGRTQRMQLFPQHLSSLEQS